jgi:large conductance mechanosensitive channel
MLKEFKAFIMRGNVVDLAVAVVIGAAFGAIIKSFVDDIIMPPLGLVVGHLDFSNLFLTLKDGPKAPPPYMTPAAAKDAGAVTLNYGAFLNSVITFLIVGAAVFLLVKAVNRASLKPAPAEAAPSTKPCPRCTLAIPLAATRCPNCTSDVVG